MGGEREGTAGNLEGELHVSWRGIFDHWEEGLSYEEQESDQSSLIKSHVFEAIKSRF